MAAKYSRLSTEDPEQGQVAFDFSSTQCYSSQFTTSPNDYKSIYTYSRGDMQLREDHLHHTVVKQSFVSRICSLLITAICFILIVVTFPISAWITIKIVSDCERLVVFRLGRLQGVKGPGITFVMPCIDNVKKVDVRMKAFTVPPLQILTSDAGIIEFGADVYYQVTDAMKSVTSVQDLNSQLRGLVRNRLMNTLTKFDLQVIEDKKDENVAKIVAECNNSAHGWGANICRVDLSPIKVLQAAKTGAILPGLGGQEGLSQVFQHLAQSFLSSGQGQRGTSTMLPAISESEEASGAAIAMEDVTLVPGITPAHLVELVRGVLSESLVRTVDAVYQFNLTGNNGGTFYLDLKHGAGYAGEGSTQNPDVTLDLSVRDMQSMFADQLKPLQAYMSGRLKVSGDLSAAMRLEEVMDKVVNNTASSSVAGHTVVNI
ncbi:stomatin-like protein 1 [Ruditapes philippinarum]|uniref:stomatin-like protein 1 n=1 Tax=Ruditapes philippinarum TaxID=129788 RepID=UPI00295ADEA6|nr:stomatin-like protein 1 [Ruditapes philippinarum]